MNIKEEIINDFNLKLPRVLVSGDTGILDNVKKVVMISPNTITVDNGERFTTVMGENLLIKQLEDERMLINGEIRTIEFFGTLHTD